MDKGSTLFKKKEIVVIMITFVTRDYCISR